ncbi:MAG: peptidoglycan-binding domain-containing protein [Candidatus Paceibacterota bacterium]
MKKIILSLFLLVAVILVPVFGASHASAQVASASCIKVPPVLKMGSTGQQVTNAQKALITLGFLNIPAPTGFFGFKTKAAVMQAQIQFGITPFDGVIGLKTATWLNNLTNCNGVIAPGNTTVSGNTQGQQNNNQNQQNQNNQTQTTNTQNNQNNQNNQNQNNQTQTTNTNNQNNQNQQPGVTQNLTAPCAANTAPFVEVDSPNGGEIYNSTDKLEVKWSTCNLANPGTKMRVTLLHLNDVVMTADVPNTGSHIFILTPALIMNPPVPPVQPIAFDKLFKVQVSAFAVNGAPSDMSDNTFAILDNGANPNPNPNINPGNAAANPNLGWPLGCVWPLTVVNNLNGQPCVKPLPGANPGPTVAADVCANSPLPHVVIAIPNGGEKFVIGQMMDTMWFNCNIPAGVDIQISLVQTTNTGLVQYIIEKQTPNDGLQAVKLVALPGSPALVPGDNYQLRLDFVLTPAYTGPANPQWLQWGVDLSDAFFTLVQ